MSNMQMAKSLVDAGLYAGILGVTKTREIVSKRVSRRLLL